MPQGLDGHVAGPADALDLLRLLDGAQGGQQGQNIFDCQGGVPLPQSGGVLLGRGGRGVHRQTIQREVGGVDAGELAGGREQGGHDPVHVLGVEDVGGGDAALLGGLLPGEHFAVPLDELLVRLVDEQPRRHARGRLGHHQPDILGVDAGQVVEAAVDREGVHILVVALHRRQAGVQEYDASLLQHLQKSLPVACVKLCVHGCLLLN